MSNIQHKEVRPGNQTATGDRLKLHLRVLNLNGKTWRILSLRPGTDAKFSTNYFHDTWHIVTDNPGAQLLSRILWGMSYQREPGTVFLLHSENIKPTPFEAEPSQPFLICPANLSAPNPQAFRELKSLLSRLPKPTVTVRLQTWGMDETIAMEDWDERDQRTGFGLGDGAYLWQRERMTYEAGIICYAALPAILRKQACAIASLHTQHEDWSEYHYLAENQGGRTSHPGDGEVQVFKRYREMLSDAEEARREVARDNGGTLPDLLPERLREAVWDQATIVSQRRSKGFQTRRSFRRVPSRL